jgi:hypothetical protein
MAKGYPWRITKFKAKRIVKNKIRETSRLIFISFHPGEQFSQLRNHGNNVEEKRKLGKFHDLRFLSFCVSKNCPSK